MEELSIAHRDEGDLAALMASLDTLVAGAKSFFPGRVLLSRKQTYRLLDLMIKKLLEESEAQSVAADFETYRRAVEAVGGVNALASGGNAGPSIWRIWFADVSRKRLSPAVEELRSALAPFIASEASSPR